MRVDGYIAEQIFVAEVESLLRLKLLLFQIKYVSARDAGKYECQLSTVPKISRWIDLVVVVPKVWYKTQRTKVNQFCFRFESLVDLISMFVREVHYNWSVSSAKLLSPLSLLSGNTMES